MAFSFFAVAAVGFIIIAAVVIAIAVANKK